MVNQLEGEVALIRNLKDAGCPPDVIETILKYEEDEKHSEQLRVLAKQRRCLLDQVHNSQKQLDCLDYLIYTMKKEK